MNPAPLLPFAASAEVYARILFGQPSAAPAEDPRALTRCRILSAGRPLTLTIPVEGGARPLARGAEPSSLRLSSHGDWPRAFRAAFATAYSRTPFYPHVAPRLDALLALPAANPGLTLGAFLRETDTLVRSLLPDAPLLRGPLTPVLESVCREAAEGADLSLSLLHHLFHLGPDAIFLLRGAFI